MNKGQPYLKRKHQKVSRRQLKKQIRSAYAFDASRGEKDFIRQHEQRSLQLWDIIMDELKFMGWKSILSGTFLCIILIFVSRNNEPASVWSMSSFLPLLALLLTVVLGRSERYKMSELEASCRFSLRFVRTVRMFIVGIASLLIVFLGTYAVSRGQGGSFIVAMYHVACPYLLNVFACLLITRKWHSKEDLFACAGATFITCLIPSMVNALHLGVALADTEAAILLILLLSMTVIESVLYVKEGDKVIWNFG